jgi:predicted esterase
MDAKAAARLARRSPLTIVLGTHDQFAKPELIAAQEVRLKELDIPHTTIRFEGGHEIVPEMLTRLTEEAAS